MTEAFTVRLRTQGGRHSLWLAPAGGMGLSSPCCVAGHDSASGAMACGTQLLTHRLLGTPPLAASA